MSEEQFKDRLYALITEKPWPATEMISSLSSALTIALTHFPDRVAEEAIEALKDHYLRDRAMLKKKRGLPSD